LNASTIPHQASGRLGQKLQCQSAGLGRPVLRHILPNDRGHGTSEYSHERCLGAVLWVRVYAHYALDGILNQARKLLDWSPRPGPVVDGTR
jgi:hypothetical protein